MEIIENKKKYDVVIVGSGAGGGMAEGVYAGVFLDASL